VIPKESGSGETSRAVPFVSISGTYSNAILDRVDPPTDTTYFPPTGLETIAADFTLECL